MEDIKMSNANVSVYLSEFPLSNKLSTPIFTSRLIQHSGYTVYV